MAIMTRDLRKTYRGSKGDETLAVDGLTMHVRRGEFFGLLGPNGAGKSTTVGMLTTRVRPTAGEALVDGIDIATDPVAVKRRIGVVTQHNTLDRQLTVAENLEFRGRYCGLSTRQARVRAAELLETFELTSRADALVHQVSGGQAQRLLIARALVNNPEVLFLDEPTSGLDPQTRVRLWDVLRAMHAQGQTIVLTTHYLEEAEGLCERVGVVDHGQVLACDTVATLVATLGCQTSIAVQVDGPAKPLVGPVGALENIGEATDEDNVLRVTTTAGERVLGAVVNAVLGCGRAIEDITVLRPSLETVFLALTGREYRE